MRRIGAVSLAICVILAVLLPPRVVTIVVSSLIFAVALVVCGVLTSRWHRHSAHK
jgi:hypothetical protein